MRISDWSSDVCSSDLFTVCQAAVWRTPDGHWCSTCSDRFYVDLAARWLVYTSPVRDEEAGGSMLRVIKYVKRGYSIQVDSLGRVIDRIVSAVDEDRARDVGRSVVIAGLLREVDPDRKSVVSGKRVSVRVDLGGRRIFKKKQKHTK